MTAENYGTIGRAFIGLKGAFVVALEETKVQHDIFPATLRQWGAWRAYFRRVKIPTRLMEAKKIYTVPAEWPHMFDAGASMADDFDAGINFERHVADRVRRERSTFVDKAQKAATVAAYRSSFPRQPKAPLVPKDHLEAPKEPLGEFPAHLLETDWLESAA